MHEDGLPNKNSEVVRRDGGPNSKENKRVRREMMKN